VYDFCFVAGEVTDEVDPSVTGQFELDDASLAEPDFGRAEHQDELVEEDHGLHRPFEGKCHTLPHQLYT